VDIQTDSTRVASDQGQPARLNRFTVNYSDGKMICPRQWQFDLKIAADPQSAHLWRLAVAKLQAASVPIA